MQRKRLLITSKKRLLLHLLIAMLIISGFRLWCFPQEEAVPVAVIQQEKQLPADWISWRSLMMYELPIMAIRQDMMSSSQPVEYFTYDFHELFYLFTNVRIQDIRSIFHVELPRLAMLKQSDVVASFPTKKVIEKKAKQKNLLKKGQVLIGIYHTHTAESFVPSSGVAHAPGGQAGEIVAVGAELTEQLSQLGIAAVQDTTIHDYPSFMKAYGASEVTVKQMVEKYPALEMVFDIHRDAEKRGNVTFDYQGKAVAQITILVAQGQVDLPQPHWEENYAMAQKLDKKCKELYPGLSKGIQVAEWRYNQHLHPHALLLEVGSHETSLDEAKTAIRYFAEVIDAVLREEIKE